MDNQSVLENIKATQAQLVAELQQKAVEYPDGDFSIAYAAAKKAETMDLTPYIDKMAEELTEAFDVWKENMEYDESEESIGHVHIEWSYNEGSEALAYGYTEYDGDSVFDDCSAFYEALKKFRESTAGIEKATTGTDYQIAKIAEIFWYAMEKATQSDSFKNLSKSDEITFELTRHDRGEIDCYIWNK